MKHPTSADLVILGGRFRTMDPTAPYAGALAVSQGRIIAAGREKDVRKCMGSGTRVIDAGGRLGLPGFWDSHIHFRDWSLGRQWIDFSTALSFEDFQEQLRKGAEKARERGGEPWVLGQGWNETDWAGARAPLREDLDAIVPGLPALLWRCDLHMAVANSKALELAGMDLAGAASSEEIGRDGQGRPNGHLREQAINRMREAMPPASDAAVQEAMLQGMKFLNTLGITTVHDVKLMAEAEAVQTLRVWQRLRERREMSLRAWVSLADTQMDAAVGLGLRMGLGDEWLRLGHVKFFADGGMGARTAWMLDPYEDGGTGLSLWDMDELLQKVEKAEAAGFAVMIHSIGNRAVREIIGLYEKLEAGRPESRQRPTPRHRIEHLQMVEPEDLARLSRLPVTVCMQPFNLVLDINLLDRCLGGRSDRTYAFRDVLDSGTSLLFSSDAPVCDPSPLAGIHGAVNRRSPARDAGAAWHSKQCITVEEAVRAYTSSPAREYGVWSEQGSLSPGKWADLILVDRDIFSIDPLEIGGARVDLAMAGGEVVHGNF